MSTISYSTDAQRPSGAIPVLPSPASERIDHLEGLAEAAQAQGDARSVTYLSLAEEARNARGDVDAYLAKCRAEGHEAHAGSLAEMEQRRDRAERALRLHTEAAPYIDANGIGRLRRDCIIEARRHGAKAKPWSGRVRKGATVQTLRGVLHDLKVERSSVEAAPPPLADELDRLYGEIDAAAARGMPKAAIVTDDVYGNRHPMGRMKLRSASQINWPTVTLDADRRSANHEPLVVLDAASMISWLFGDEIKRALRTQLEAAYKQFDGAMLTEAQRRIELKRIASEVLAVEQEIAALAWPAIFDGDHEATRHLFDLSPKAVLGLEV